MRRTVNVRALLIILAALVLGGVGIYFLHGRQLDQQVALYLQKADQAVAEKEYRKALEYLDQYLRLRPDDTEVVVRHAVLLDSSAQSSADKIRAFLALEAALRGAAQGNTELHVRAADRALGLNRHREAKQHLEALLRKDPQQFDWKEKLAQAEAGLGNPAGAEKHYRDILKQANHRVSTAMALAALLEQGRKLDQADAVLAELVKANPTSAEARLARCQFLRSRGRLEDAARELEVARGLAKDDATTADVLLASAEIAQARNQSADAIRYFAEGMQRFPKDVRFYLGQAQLELLRGAEGRPTALALLRQATPLVAGGSSEQLMLTKFFLDAGDPAEARRLSESIKARYGASPVLDYVTARLLYDEGKIGEAVVAFERIRPELARIPALSVEADFHLATAYEQLGNHDRQLAALERILKIAPTSVEVLRSKAAALAAAGRLTEAIDLYRRLLNARVGVRVALARLLILNEHRKPAAQRTWDEPKTLLAQCSPEDKKTRDHRLTTCLLHWSAGNLDEFQKALEAARRDDPKEPAYWVATIALLERRHANDDKARLAAVRTCLDEADRAVGNHVELRLARLRYADRLNPEQALVELARIQQGIENIPPKERVSLLLGLASSYGRLGKTAEAKKWLTAAAELPAGAVTALLGLLELAVLDRQDAEADRLIQLLKAKEGAEGVAWRMAQVNQSLARAKTAPTEAVEARRVLHEIEERRPNWYRIASAQGKLHELDRRPDLALEKYVRAVDAGERNPEIVNKAVQGLLDRKRHEEARRLVALTLDDLGDTPVFARLASVVALAANEPPGQALAYAEKVLRQESKDFREHLWLGNFRWVAGDQPGAEEAFKKALELAPGEPQAWADWLLFLAQTNRQEQAKQAIPRAAEALQERLPTALIPYYETLGERDQAEAQYRILLQRQPDDVAVLESLAAFYCRGSNPEKAEAHLKTLIQSSKADAERIARARRMYALLLNAKGEANSFRNAMAQLEENLRKDPRNPHDLRTRALIQASRPGMRREVIADLEQSFAISPPAPNEAVILAQLYEGNGQWKKAAALLQETINTKDGESPFILSYFLRALLRNHQVNEAAVLLQKLEAKDPGNPATLDARVRVMSARGQRTEAVALLNQATERAYEEKKNAEVFLGAAQLLDELGESAAADVPLQRYVALTAGSNPNVLVTRAGLLARLGRMPEALQLCEQAATRLPAPETALALVGVLATGTPDAAAFSRVEARLQSLRQAARDDLRLALAFADFYQLSGRTPEAESIYRTLLEKQPGNPVIMNNFAWLLSERSDGLQDALALINQAIERFGPDGSLLDTRGMILVRTKQYSRAITDLTEAVAQVPKPGRWMHLAYAHHLSGNASEAKNVWKKATLAGLNRAKLTKGDQICFDELARIYGQVN